MEYEFYIDVFFLVNFYLNLLSLLLTAAWRKRKYSVIRLGLAAVFGSFWNCIWILFPVLTSSVELLITIVGVGGAMLMIAFQDVYTSGNLRYIREIGCLFLSAGLVNSCYSFVCQQFYLTEKEGLILTGFACILLGQFLRQWVTRHEKIGDRRYRVSLYYKGRMKTFLAMADSGNRLCVPETGKPVSLISYRDCTGFCEDVTGGFYIPYHAIGTEKGMLFAIPFEKMEIEQDGRSMTIENPVVAIVKERLSVNGDFSMILPETYVPETQ